MSTADDRAASQPTAQPRHQTSRLIHSPDHTYRVRQAAPLLSRCVADEWLGLTGVRKVLQLVSIVQVGACVQIDLCECVHMCVECHASFMSVIGAYVCTLHEYMFEMLNVRPPQSLCPFR